MYSVIKVFNYVFSMGLLCEFEDDFVIVYIDCFVVVLGEVQSQVNVMVEGVVIVDEFGSYVVGGIDGVVKWKWREVRLYWGYDFQFGLMDCVLFDSMLMYFLREELREKKVMWDVIMVKCC